MSRIGGKAIPVPNGISVVTEGSLITVSGKSGNLSCRLPPEIIVSVDRENGSITVQRDGDSAKERSLHGLVRSLIANMVTGVVRPWEKRLEIVGVGYQAVLSGTVLTLNVGYANPISVRIPPGVVCVVTDPTHVILSSPDKQLVGQLAADVRSLRKPEPYKGKGIRYFGETVRRKSGKAFGS
jgi:large subunit ribosomal protein L6